MIGNLVGVVVLVVALVTTKSDDLDGVQLLVTTGTIWAVNVIVFGLCYWDLDDGGPFERARHERKTPDFRFPQDETPNVARPGWHPRVWDYIFVALTSATAFQPDRHDASDGQGEAARRARGVRLSRADRAGDRARGQRPRDVTSSRTSERCPCARHTTVSAPP